MTSFILLLTIVINTHFNPLKDLSKTFALYDKWEITMRNEKWQWEMTMRNENEKWQMTSDNVWVFLTLAKALLKNCSLKNIYIDKKGLICLAISSKMTCSKSTKTYK